MKRFALMFLLTMLFTGCGSSSDDYKNYQTVKTQKDGTIALIGEISGEGQLPRSYHKVYFNKKGKVIKEHHIISGDPKRSSMYIYRKDGKIEEIRHFENKKYNGVSKYVYNGGNIETEDMYDRDLNFVFSKKFN